MGSIHISNSKGKIRWENAGKSAQRMHETLLSHKTPPMLTPVCLVMGAAFNEDAIRNLHFQFSSLLRFFSLFFIHKTQPWYEKPSFLARLCILYSNFHRLIEGPYSSTCSDSESFLEPNLHHYHHRINPVFWSVCLLNRLSSFSSSTVLLFCNPMASQLLNTNPRGSKPLNPNAHAFQPWKSLKAYYLPHHLYETQERMQLPAAATVLDFAYQPVSLPLLRYSSLGCYSAQFHHQPLHLRASSILYPSVDFPITYVGSTKDSVTEVMEDLGDSVSSRGETRKVSGVPMKKMIAPRLKRSQRRSSMAGGDKNGTSVWRARKFLNGDGCGDDPLPPSDVNALELSLSGKTTVMIRNIPNKMRFHLLPSFLTSDVTSIPRRFP